MDKKMIIMMLILIGVMMVIGLLVFVNNFVVNIPIFGGIVIGILINLIGFYLIYKFELLVD